MNLQTHSRPDPSADTRTGEGSPRRYLRRPRVNITPAERACQVVADAIAVIAAAALLASAGSAFAVVLEALLAVAGLDLAVTGALSHCPLYQRLG